MKSTIATYLKYADLQLAAEAFITPKTAAPGTDIYASNYPLAVDRQHWIAHFKASITDTARREPIAGHVWYSIEPGQGSKTGGNR